MLEVCSLSVSYGRTQVLWDIAFSVAKGSITTILGSNGAGKSTILRSLAGLLEIESGIISFENKSIQNLEPHDRVKIGISLVPGERRLFPHMTVEENLQLGAYIRRARAKTTETLQYVFDLFPILKERRNQLAETLSGGEQQMTAIARGLMSQPRMLMLDEPSLGLDPITTSQMFKLLVTINNLGVTVLLIEQNVNQALKISDQIYVLESGNIVAQGSPAELSKEEHIKKAYLTL